MAHTEKKLSELPTTNTVTKDDMLLVLKDPSGTPSTKTVSVKNLFLTSNLVYTSITILPIETPSSSSVVTTTGKIACDANYLYISTGPNTIKRIPLQSF